METLWKLKPETEILFECSGKFSAAFCATTGETHVLDAFPSEVLWHLALDTAVSSQTISVAIAAFMEEPVAEWEPKVGDTLRTLKAMYLVESVPG